MFLGIHEKGQKDQTKRKKSKDYRVLDNTRIHDFNADDFQYSKKLNSECNNPDKHFCQTTMKKKVDGQESKNLNNQGPEWKSCTVRTAEKVGISVLHVFSEIKNVK